MSHARGLIARKKFPNLLCVIDNSVVYRIRGDGLRIPLGQGELVDIVDSIEYFRRTRQGKHDAKRKKSKVSKTFEPTPEWWDRNALGYK